MAGQVRLNRWNGGFFDSISNREVGTFVHQLTTFLMIVGVLLALTVMQTFLQERLKFRTREWITRHLLAEWLRPMRVYQLRFAGDWGENPDQRIQEDTRVLGDATADLACGIVYSSLLIMTFGGVLWNLSSQVTFDLGGHNVAIPGYMFWCAFLYAFIGSVLTWIVGRPLIVLNALRYARESDFRFALVRVNDSAESIALQEGEDHERRQLERALQMVIEVMRRLSISLAGLTWITSGFGWVSIVVPVLVASPAYFQGHLTIGGMIMVAGAFGAVQWAMRWFVENFARLAEWRAALHRVGRFREVLDQLPEVREGVQTIRRTLNPQGKMSFDNVSVFVPNGKIVTSNFTATIAPGERVLLLGETGSGKSTLLRAAAGIWPWGCGTIELPDVKSFAFLPQRPYMPLGTLRSVVSYPSSPSAFSDDEIRRALDRCDLGHLAEKLDRTARWDKQLSLGEQERIVFVRLLLHKPNWAFLDEPTAALDSRSQERIMSLFDNELKNTTLISIGHRPDLGKYHTRTLQLAGGRIGEQARAGGAPDDPARALALNVEERAAS